MKIINYVLFKIARPRPVCYEDNLPYMSDDVILSHFNNLMRFALLQW